MGPAPYRRGFQLLARKMLLHTCQRRMGIGRPGGENLQGRFDIFERIAGAKRQHMLGHRVRRRVVEFADEKIARRNVTAEPRPNFGLGAAVERQRMRMHIEERERQVGDAKTEPRSVR